ncbi:MAG TPA: hypothetical protein VKU87_02425, partial [Thermomicrobiaceae bacterium]|nr:hypothetical protein [Thermomicrobiaceae bacterium]
MRRAVSAGLIAFAVIGLAACGSTGGVGNGSTSVGSVAAGASGTAQMATARGSATAVTLPSELTTPAGKPSTSPVASITPDANGLYRDIALARAQKLAPFPVIAPAPSSIPASLKFNGINASANPPGTLGLLQEVDLYYTVADGARN